MPFSDNNIGHYCYLVQVVEMHTLPHLAVVVIAGTLYYIGGSLYVGLRLIFQDGDKIYNFQMIITLSSYHVPTYKWLI